MVRKSAIYGVFSKIGKKVIRKFFLHNFSKISPKIMEKLWRNFGETKKTLRYTTKYENNAL